MRGSGPHLCPAFVGSVIALCDVTQLTVPPICIKLEIQIDWCAWVKITKTSHPIIFRVKVKMKPRQMHYCTAHYCNGLWFCDACMHACPINKWRNTVYTGNSDDVIRRCIEAWEHGHWPAGHWVVILWAFGFWKIWCNGCMGIVDSWLGTNNWQYIAHAINLIYRIQLCKMSESEAEVQ